MDNQAYVSPKGKLDKKLFIIGGAITAILIMVGVIAVIVINNNKISDAGIESEDISELAFTRTEDFSEILNIYNNIYNDMTIENFNTVLELGKISKEYMHLDESNDSLSYIATTNIDPNLSYLDQDIEFITFNYIPADEEIDFSSRIDNLMYYGYRDGIKNTIAETSDDGYTYVIDGLSIEHDNKYDAIEDYLSRGE